MLPTIAHLLSPDWSLAATRGRLLWVAVGLLFLPGAALAEAPRSAEPGFVVKRWTVADGLPIDTLSAVAQTPDGALWIATMDGLARFDGATFDVWRQDTAPGVPHDRYTDLVVDGDGTLWAVTESGHLLRRRPGGALEVALAPDGQRAAEWLARDGAGGLWGVGGASLVALADGEATPRFVDAVRQPVALVRDDRDDGWFVSTRLDGVVHLGVDGAVRSVPVGDTLIGAPGALAVTRDGRLWARSPMRLLQGGRGGLRSLGQVDRARHDYLLALGQTPDGDVFTWTRTVPVQWWRAAADGVQPLAPGTPPPALPDGARWRIAGDTLYDGDAVALRGVPAARQAPFVDRAGQAWLATEGAGLWLVRRAAVRSTTRADGRPIGPVYPVLAEPDGTLWAGGREALLRRRGGGWSRLAWPDAAVYMVTALARDHTGRVWVAGLPGVGIVEGDAVRTVEGLPPGVMPPQSIFEARDHTLYLGGPRTLTRRSADGRFSVVARWDEYAPARAMVQLDDDTLLVGTATRGLMRVDGATVEWLGTAEGLPSDAIRHLLRTADGAVWIATEGRGVCRLKLPAGAPLRTATVQCAGPEDGLYDGFVHALAEDARGRIWMSTNRGVFRVDRAALEARLAGGPPVRSVVYGVGEGMATREANGGLQPPVARLPDGTLVFPTMEGVVEVRTDEPPRPPPTVTLRSPSGAPLPAGVDLPTDARRLAVRWSTPIFDRAEHVVFRHRLAPEGGWSAPTTERDLVLQAVPPGDHTLQVQAALGAAWGPVATLAVRAPPRFVETPWYPATLTLASVLLVGLAGWQRARLQRRRAEHLEGVVAERSAELAQRNVELGDTARRLEEGHEALLLTQGELVQQREVLLQQAGELAMRNRQVEAQATRLAELDALKTRFLANISHELRTPLTLVAGTLDDLEGHPDAEVARKVAVAGRNAQRLGGLIDQLLEAARLADGGVVLRARRGDLGGFVRRVVERFGDAAARRDVALTVAAPARPLVAYFDDDLLDKALANLVSNALKFTEAGGRVEVALRAEPEDQRAVLTVRDTGVGIPGEVGARVFERFFQVDQGDARRHEGAGIGLSLAAELVALHGGRIAVDSVEGEGSTFTVELPLDAAHLSPEEIDTEGLGGARSTPPPDLEPAPDDGRPTVLVVEDNDDMRAYLVEHLAGRFAVRAVGDGAAALEASRAARPAVIVSDVMMPGVDGLEMCRRLRADPSLADVPVVLVSAKAGEQARLDGLALADDYLPKPFSVAELRARVARLAERAATGPRTPPEGIVAVEVPDEAPAEPEADVAWRASLVELVDARLGDSDFNVDAMAKGMAVSRRQLQREVPRLTGESPVVFLRGRRLERARDLLLRGAHRTVGEVAAAVGLSAPYLSRLYANTFGHPPSEDLRAPEAEA